MVPNNPEQASSVDDSFASPTVADLRELPGVSSFSLGVPRLPSGDYTPFGAVIRGSASVAIGVTHDCASFAEATFTGWNRRDFDYCPHGPWADWVALARRILAVEEWRLAFDGGAKPSTLAPDEVQRAEKP